MILVHTSLNNIWKNTASYISSFVCMMNDADENNRTYYCLPPVNCLKFKMTWNFSKLKVQ